MTDQQGSDGQDPAYEPPAVVEVVDVDEPLSTAIGSIVPP